jgi:microcystin-dependent protein
MSEPFLGEIRMFGGNFAPRGWAFCNGQILSIAQNTALFSLLGTTYGGNGQTTFALPDLRGRSPMHWGQGPGLTNRTLGERSGTEAVKLTRSQMPAHSHEMRATGTPANSVAPVNRLLAVGGNQYQATWDQATVMSSRSIGPTGSDQPHANMHPYLAVSFIIALEGIFPSRN